MSLKSIRCLPVVQLKVSLLSKRSLEAHNHRAHADRGVNFLDFKVGVDEASLAHLGILDDLAGVDAASAEDADLLEARHEVLRHIQVVTHIALLVLLQPSPPPLPLLLPLTLALHLLHPLLIPALHPRRPPLLLHPPAHCIAPTPRTCDIIPQAVPRILQLLSLLPRALRRTETALGRHHALALGPLPATPPPPTSKQPRHLLESHSALPF